jgi:hypothetical protein
MSHSGNDAPLLDNSSRYPQVMRQFFINIACSRQVRPRRLNPISSRNREHLFVGDICSTGHTKNSLAGRSAASDAACI